MGSLPEADTPWALHLCPFLLLCAFWRPDTLRQSPVEAQLLEDLGQIMLTALLVNQQSWEPSTVMALYQRPVVWHTAGARKESCGPSMTLVEQTRSLPSQSKERGCRAWS